MASNASNFSDDDFAADPECEFECLGEIQDVFSYDFATGSEDGPTLATVNSAGEPAYADEETNDGTLTFAYNPGGISDDGSAATFVSTAPNLDDGDTNNQADAFVRRFGGGSSSSGSGDPYTVTATGADPNRPPDRPGLPLRDRSTTRLRSRSGPMPLAGPQRRGRSTSTRA